MYIWEREERWLLEDFPLMETSLVSSLTGAQLASYQIAVAAKIAQSNADAYSIAQLTAAAAQNFAQRGGVASDVGANIDIIA
jgi:hypothetical protein